MLCWYNTFMNSLSIDFHYIQPGTLFKSCLSFDLGALKELCLLLSIQYKICTSRFFPPYIHENFQPYTYNQYCILVPRFMHTSLQIHWLNHRVTFCYLVFSLEVMFSYDIWTYNSPLCPSLKVNLKRENPSLSKHVYKIAY